MEVMASRGGVLGAAHGCGGGAFLPGRRSVSRSVVLYCMILFCRTTLLQVEMAARSCSWLYRERGLSTSYIGG